MWQKVAKFKGAEYFRKALYIEYREHKVEYIIIDLLDLLSILYYDRPARSTVYFIL